ncbi:MAG: SAM-dependent methyltransferase [Rhodocyclales bacterium]|nr:SAM-dependent methyltransferase [Rhodocyclales bacterium]
MPGYQVKFQRVGVAGSDDMDIRSLLDRQQYADPLGEARAAGISPASWPLFGQLWPSAEKLADLMQAWEIGSRRVLEIGCGLGLASLVVHRRGGDITASDCHPLAEAFLQENLLLNKLPAMKYLPGDWARANQALGEFDLIIGSDVLYEPGLPQLLAAFIERHAAWSSEVLIVDPNRGNRIAFNRCMARLGFGLSERQIDAPLHDGSPYRGRLLHYRRAARPRAWGAAASG